MQKLNISAIIVGLNEGHLLDNCLASITFCDDITYFDLGSTDESITIAGKYGAKINLHEKVPAVEIIHANYCHLAKHNWVLFIDPDEVVDPVLVKEFYSLFNENKLSEVIGAVAVPIKFYYKNKQLKGTPWGYNNKRILLANNKKFTFTADVHFGRTIKPGFEILWLKENNRNILHHYWMKNFATLVKKHKRYLKSEGKVRYTAGERASILRILYTPLSQFYFSFIIKRGYKDFALGLLLSFFWAWYQTSALIEVYTYQRKNNTN